MLGLARRDHLWLEPQGAADLKGFALCRRPPRTRDALIGPWGFVDKELILETAWIEPLMFLLWSLLEANIST